MAPDDSRLDAVPLDRLAEWLVDVVPGTRAPFAWSVLNGGRSNLSIEAVDANGRGFVVRRPPPGDHLATAHDMAREFRIQSGLGCVGYPVPVVHAYTDDASIAGAECYVMDRVDGLVIRGAASVAPLREGVRRHAGLAAVEALARLHAVDLVGCGLDDLAPHGGYLQRQLRRWSRQWDASVADLVSVADTAFHRVYEQLIASAPEDTRTVLVHGDFRLENTVVDDDGEILAVLDWELATLGDPLADLGLLLVYWGEPGDAVVPLPDPPTTAPGFPSRAEVAAAYFAARPELDHLDRTRDLDWYVAFASWKLAAILQGVDTRRRARSATGTIARGEEDETFEAVVPALVDVAAEWLS